jgi:hypothetical protein
MCLLTGRGSLVDASGYTFTDKHIISLDHLKTLDAPSLMSKYLRRFAPLTGTRYCVLLTGRGSLVDASGYTFTDKDTKPGKIKVKKTSKV